MPWYLYQVIIKPKFLSTLITQNHYQYVRLWPTHLVYQDLNTHMIQASSSEALKIGN